MPHQPQPERGLRGHLEAFTSCTGSLRETDAADLAACSYDKDPSIAVLPLTEGLVDLDFDGVYLDLKFSEDELAGWEHPNRTDQTLLNLLYQHGAGGLITDHVAELTAAAPPPCGIPPAP